MSAVISMHSRPSFTPYRVDLGTRLHVKLRKRPKLLKNHGLRSVLQEAWCNQIPMSSSTTLLASNRPLHAPLQTKLVLQEPHQCQDQSQTCRVVHASGIDWCKSVKTFSRLAHTQMMTLWSKSLIVKSKQASLVVIARLLLTIDWRHLERTKLINPHAKQ